MACSLGEGKEWRPGREPVCTQPPRRHTLRRRIARDHTWVAADPSQEPVGVFRW